MKKVVIYTMVLTFAFVGAACFAGTADSGKTKPSWGIGFGIPYGILGCNYDIRITNSTSLSMGMGSTILAGMAYCVGVKQYLVPPDMGFRPRVSACYGTNAVIEQAGYFISEYKSYMGLNFGFGAEIMFGSSKANGIDLDVMYIATTGWDENTVMQQGGRTKISIGYRHVF